jgi:hypothetical protein
MAVPVTGQDGLLGVVGLASKRHGAFMEYWCVLSHGAVQTLFYVVVNMGSC